MPVELEKIASLLESAHAQIEDKENKIKALEDELSELRKEAEYNSFDKTASDYEDDFGVSGEAVEYSMQNDSASKRLDDFLLG